MKTINIKNKLENMGVILDGIIMGDFDYIGEFTAKRDRRRDDPNYKKYGAFYRANYERGILIYHLIRQYNVTSMLEIGFGRGYSTFCAAKAFHDAGIAGKITTVDPALNENYVKQLGQVFPKEWFSYINFNVGSSKDVVPAINQRFDLVYIDGDHSYNATKLDWEMTKNNFDKFLLFDDYHLPTKQDAGIQCRHAIDEIDETQENCKEKELIILDRRMFFDDRQFTDEQIDYGQVLLTKNNISERDEW
jgi:predicted O-methyltransferase YrrM